VHQSKTLQKHSNAHIQDLFVDRKSIATSPSSSMVSTRRTASSKQPQLDEAKALGNQSSSQEPQDGHENEDTRGSRNSWASIHRADKANMNNSSSSVNALMSNGDSSIAQSEQDDSGEYIVKSSCASCANADFYRRGNERQ
jgi:hypothetical protein